MIAVGFMLLLLSTPPPALRTTWNEPTHEEVVRNADAFVLARVLSVEDGRRSAVFRVVRPIAGADVPPVFSVDGFCLLSLMSYSSNAEPRLPIAFRPGVEIYLFVRLSADGRSYEIATPTTGFALIDGGRVRACYRHSSGLALVGRDLYERTQAAIFRNLHGGAIDAALMAELVSANLHGPPKVVEDDPLSPASLVFFNQHAALETFYYLGSASDLPLLEPFLASKDEYVRISAVRALSRIDTPAAKKRMLALLTEPGEPSIGVQAIAGLRRQKARELASALAEIVPKLDAREAGAEVDLMDPRIGTRSGSAKAAAQALLAEWAAPEGR